MKGWNYRQSLDTRPEDGTPREIMPTPTSAPCDAEHYSRSVFRPGQGRTKNAGSETDSDALRETESTKRRKAVGGLRLARAPAGIIDQPTPPRTPPPKPSRQLQANLRNFPQRKRQRTTETHALRPSTWDKLVLGIWEQIHGPIRLDWTEQGTISSTQNTFQDVSTLCLRVSQASRRCRSLEVIVQAHWVECYDAHVDTIVARQPNNSLSEAKKTALSEACRDFGWSEKVLRNKM
jgi:hypothetical protein